MAAGGYLRVSGLIAAISVVVSAASCTSDSTRNRASSPTASVAAEKVVEDVTFTPDPECRNGGEVSAEGTSWMVLTSQPGAWRHQRAVEGTLTITGERGFFSDEEGHGLAVTNEAVSAVCVLWPESSPT